MAALLKNFDWTNRCESTENEDSMMINSESEFKQFELYAIGNNSYGQQGNGGNENIEAITKIKTFKKRIKNIVTAGGRMNGVSTYIIFDDKTYECCGDNKYGQLGVGHYKNINIWHQITNMHIENIFSSPGSHHSFCISNDNKLYSVGLNKNNQFGIKTNESNTNKWIDINTSLYIKKVSTASDGYSTFLTQGGQIYVAGQTWDGGLGLGHDNSSPIIQRIKIKIKFKNIDCGFKHTLAIDDDHGVWSWGHGGNGKLGHGDAHNRSLPVRIEYFVKNDIKIKNISCGYKHNMILSLNNKIYCFGSNEHYQCGNGLRKHVYLPQPNETLKDETVINIKCGAAHNVIKTAANRYYLWGWNNYGQCLYVAASIWSYFSNPPQYIKRPLLFNSNYFDNEQEIIDIYPGYWETRIIIGRYIINKKDNINGFNDQDEKEHL